MILYNCNRKKEERNMEELKYYEIREMLEDGDVTSGVISNYTEANKTFKECLKDGRDVDIVMYEISNITGTSVVKYVSR